MGCIYLTCVLGEDLSETSVSVTTNMSLLKVFVVINTVETRFFEPLWGAEIGSKIEGKLKCLPEKSIGSERCNCNNWSLRPATFLPFMSVGHRELKWYLMCAFAGSLTRQNKACSEALN